MVKTTTFQSNDMKAESQKETRLLINASEVAKMLSIGESTVWALTKTEKLPAPVKVGGATRWRVADLMKFAEQANPSTTA